MKYCFEEQQYQEDAIQSTLDVFKDIKFDNSPVISTYKICGVEQSYYIESNPRLKYDDDNTQRLLLDNINRIQINRIQINRIQTQEKNNIDEKNRTNILFPTPKNNFIKSSKKPKTPPSNDYPNTLNLNITMETGTGKTYVYIRTIFELYQNFGHHKFIIVVSSIAIREGLKSAFETMKDTILREKYPDIINNCSCFIYAQADDCRHFANSSALEIMIINIQSFNKAEDNKSKGNKINKKSEKFADKTYLEYMSNIRPIIILDEPQKIDANDRIKAGKEAIKSLCPNFILRYSATHKDMYHEIYKLDFIQAIEQKLVKKIVLLSHEKNYDSDFELSISRILPTKKTCTVDLNLHIDGQLKLLKDKKQGDTIKEINWRIEKIESQPISRVTFTNEFRNEKILEKDKPFTQNKTNDITYEQVIKQKIKDTIITHLEKENSFYKERENVKVLSLFFIDKVCHYKDKVTGLRNGKFAKYFEEEFKKILESKKNTKEISDKIYNFYQDKIDKIHDGYFCKQPQSKDINDSIDQPDKIDNSDSTPYEKIIKDKKILLDEKEPLRFIFAHSALNEGWDMPNIFQICMLTHNKSQIKRIQQLGRGLRISVDSNGKRLIGDKYINNELTLITSETKDQFIQGLGEEYKEMGFTFLNEDLKNNTNTKEEKEKNEIKPNTKVLKNENFKSLCEKIKYRGRYIITDNNITDNNNNSPTLTEKIKEKIGDIITSYNPKRHYINTQKSDVTVDQNQFELKHKSRKENITNNDSLFENNKYILYKKLEEVTFLSRNSIKEIVTKVEQSKNEQSKKICFSKEDIENIFLEKISPLYNKEVSEKNIEYEFLSDKFCWDYTKTFSKTKSKKDCNKCSHEVQKKDCKESMYEVQNKDKTIYKFIQLDSNIEQKYLKEELDMLDNVKVYFKIPKDFYIHTITGRYTPDWAFVKTEEDSRSYFYFVTETKGEASLYDLRKTPQVKINSAKKFFAKLNKQKNTSVKYDIILNNK